MKREFTKQDLLTGDVVVIRNGEVGVVLKENGYIVYQKNGADDLDYFNDDLSAVFDGREFDIVEVYRGYACNFMDYSDNDLIYRREDDDYVEPVIETNLSMKKVLSDNPIVIMAQAFYGNRTCTEVYLENIDRFILGYQSDEIKVTEPIDRTIVRIPNDSNLVLVYNKYQEDEERLRKEKLLVKDNYVLKPLAVIPELDLELYSRCIVCRMNESGKLQSLQDDDYEKFIHYLAR